MQITEIKVTGGGLRYDLRNDDGEMIGRFGGMDDAAIVARYIQGANMGDIERQRAIDAMRDSQVARTLGMTLNSAKKAKRAAAALREADADLREFDDVSGAGFVAALGWMD